jgi:hypothetical protein
MQLIAHRINTIEQLKSVPSSLGIEFDVREGSEGCVVAHDPWTKGVPLETFLQHCKHAFYIVNIKCEGIEFRVLELLQSFHIDNFFLLDCSFPMIVKLRRSGESRLAVRLSEYEGLPNIGMSIEWIWIDVFTKLPVSPSDCEFLHSLGYKLCLVSSELQGHTLDTSPLHPYVDALCTKRYLSEGM